MERIGPGSSVILINHNYREMTVDTSGTNFFAMSCSFFFNPLALYNIKFEIKSYLAWFFRWAAVRMRLPWLWEGLLSERPTENAPTSPYRGETIHVFRNRYMLPGVPIYIDFQEVEISLRANAKLNLYTSSTHTVNLHCIDNHFTLTLFPTTVINIHRRV